MFVIFWKHHFLDQMGSPQLLKFILLHFSRAFIREKKKKKRKWKKKSFKWYNKGLGTMTVNSMYAIYSSLAI